jgi:hypothetical protein
MMSALSGKGITINAYDQRRTPSLCKGLPSWSAARARNAQGPTRSPSPNITRRQDNQGTHVHGLRLRAKPITSFGRGAPRYPRALQGVARLGVGAASRHTASFSRMRYNSAAHADARASSVLCKGHRARAGGCGR